jgi:hypothetical protein
VGQEGGRRVGERVSVMCGGCERVSVMCGGCEREEVRGLGVTGRRGGGWVGQEMALCRRSANSAAA